MRANLTYGRFINPLIYNSLSRGNLDGVAEDGGARVCGDLLEWVGAGIPAGEKLIIVDQNEPVAWIASAWEAEQIREAEEYKQVTEEFNRRSAKRWEEAEAAKQAAWVAFRSRYPEEVLPKGWKPAEAVSLRGLRQNSWGSGSHRRGDNLTHIHDPNKETYGGFMCGYKPTFSFRITGETATDFGAPNCKGCIKKAEAMLRRFTRKQAPAVGGAIPRHHPNTKSKHTNAMKPQTITITTELAEQICGLLETIALDHNDTSAGMLGAEIRGLLAPDVEAPEPPPDADEMELEPDVPEPEEPEEPEVEFPEPAPVEREVEFPEPAPYEREVEEDDDEQSDDYDEPPDPYGRIGIGDGLD
jgi:hypothetical protein